MITCIYSITSPTGRVYVGKSKNVKNRWATYRSLRCNGQVKIHASLRKYSPERHVFQILEELPLETPPESLATAEQKWYDHFVTQIGKDRMLNCSRPKAIAEPYKSSTASCKIPKKRQVKPVKMSQKELKGYSKETTWVPKWLSFLNF